MYHAEGKILMSIPERKRLDRTPRHRSNNNVKMDFE
jgi:hypothetical protein